MKTFGTLFSGGGGVDIGLMAAGLTPRWAVEYDADIAGVYRQNIGDHVMVADVRQVDYSALPPVDWLHASPVCTNASVANPTAGEAQSDIETARAVVRAIEAQQPQVFTLENVWGYRDFAAFRLILNALADGGYFYDFEHVNSADFGVPQTRKRLILRASRGLLPPLPQPVPWVGWYAAIEDLIPTLPESQLAPWQLARLPEELRKSLLFSSNGNYESFGEHSADEDAPALTVSGQALGRSKAVLVGEGQHMPEGNWQPITQRAADEPALTATSSFFKTKAVLVETQNTARDATVRGQGEPASTVSFAVGSRPSHMQAVFVKGDDYSGEDGIVTCAADLPAPTLRAGRSAAHRAVLFANGQYNGSVVSAESDEPSNTITGNTNQTSLRAVLFDGGNTSREATALAPSLPAMTVQAWHGMRPSHAPQAVTAVRVVAMTPRCLARFQSVPDAYTLPDKRTLAAKVIGNMVPPLLMQRIAEQMMDVAA